MFRKVSGIEKYYGWEWNITIFCRKFVVSQCRKISWGNHSIFRKYGVRRNLCIRRGYHYFPLRFSCLAVPRKFSLSKKFRDQKISCIGGGHHGFVENFCFTIPKNFVRNPFCVAEKILASKIFMLKRGGGVSRLSVEIVTSYSSQTFRRGSLLCFGKFPVSKNIMHKSGTSRFSVENLLFHSTKKIRRGTNLCFRNFLLSKKFLDKRWECHDFSSQIFCFTEPENFVGEPFSVSLISDLEKFHA